MFIRVEGLTSLRELKTRLQKIEDLNADEYLERVMQLAPLMKGLIDQYYIPECTETATVELNET